MDKLVALLGIALILGVVAIVAAWPTQLLWNGCLVGAVDGINPIGFWQALGLNILASILFKAQITNKSK